MKNTYRGSRRRLCEQRKKHFSSVSRSLDKLVYWTSLFILALFNLIAVFMLLPFLVLFKGGIVYVFVVAFGLLLGILFNLLLHGIEHLDSKHHIIAAVFIPLLAVLDILLLLVLTERISSSFLQPLSFSSSFTIAAFISAFVLPYLFSVSMRLRH